MKWKNKEKFKSALGSFGIIFVLACFVGTGFWWFDKREAETNIIKEMEQFPIGVSDTDYLWLSYEGNNPRINQEFEIDVVGGGNQVEDFSSIEMRIAYDSEKISFLGLDAGYLISRGLSVGQLDNGMNINTCSENSDICINLNINEDENFIDIAVFNLSNENMLDEEGKLLALKFKRISETLFVIDFYPSNNNEIMLIDGSLISLERLGTDLLFYENIGDGCVKSGCSGTVCVEEGSEIVTTCEWREEYICYQNTICKRLDDGSCGFVEDEEFLNCLDNYNYVVSAQSQIRIKLKGIGNGGNENNEPIRQTIPVRVILRKLIESGVQVYNEKINFSYDNNTGTYLSEAEIFDIVNTGSEIGYGEVPAFYDIFIIPPNHRQTRFDGITLSEIIDLSEIEEIKPGDLPFSINENSYSYNGNGQNGIANQMDIYMINILLDKMTDNDLLIGDVNYDGVINVFDRSLVRDGVIN